MKKILSIIISVMILCSLFVMPVHAASSIEEHYLEKGEYSAASTTIDCSNGSMTCVNVFYPADLTAKEKFPVILFCNGTGFTSATYGELLKHYSTWGYIVVGNDDTASGNGKSASDSLDCILKENSNPDSIFYNKIDTDKIGVLGHSQGGAGAINMSSVGKYTNSGMIKTMVAVSATQPAYAAAQDSAYDASKIKVPAFMFSSTDSTDIGTTGICPYDRCLVANMKNISNENIVIGQLKDTNHVTIIIEGRGYITAWFNYILLGDEYAAGAFKDGGELYTNEKWQNTTNKANYKEPEKSKSFWEKILDLIFGWMSIFFKFIGR